MTSRWAPITRKVTADARQPVPGVRWRPAPPHGDDIYEPMAHCASRSQLISAASRFVPLRERCAAAEMKTPINSPLSRRRKPNRPMARIRFIFTLLISLNSSSIPINCHDISLSRCAPAAAIRDNLRWRQLHLYAPQLDQK